LLYLSTLVKPSTRSNGHGYVHYNAPEELVEAVMSMYYGAKAKVKYSNDRFANFIDLSIRVLQGDILAPYLFVIVVDYVRRVALADQSLGLKITNKVGTSRSLPNT
jgi:hypothetical protein